jgi:hypothetical protein
MTPDTSKAIDLNKLRAALSEYFGFQKCVSDSEDDIIAKAAQEYLNTRTPAIDDRQKQRGLRSLDAMKTMLDGYTVNSPNLISDNKAMKGQLRWNDEHFQAVSAALQGQCPPGYVLVPLEPTQQMLLNGVNRARELQFAEHTDDQDRLKAAYKAIIAAAPKSIDTKLGE